MKLIGSRQEAEIREDLKKGHDALFNNPSFSRLRKAIKEAIPEIQTAYIVDWVPEQGEDIYTVLVDLDDIVSVELGRCNGETDPIVQVCSLREYEKNLKKMRRMKLLVALELASQDIGQVRTEI